MLKMFDMNDTNYENPVPGEYPEFILTSDRRCYCDLCDLHFFPKEINDLWI
jgi:hypothetical protein